MNFHKKDYSNRPKGGIPCQLANISRHVPGGEMDVTKAGHWYYRHPNGSLMGRKRNGRWTFVIYLMDSKVTNLSFWDAVELLGGKP